MVDSMDYDEKTQRHCIRGRHAAFICLAVVVSAVVVGLVVGLSHPQCSAEPPKPTTEPPPPPADRGPCKASNDSSGAWSNFRLPDYVTPVHYKLHLQPDLNMDVYEGNVAIHLKVSQPTRHLWLHIRETFVSAIPTLQLVTQGVGREVGVKTCFEYKPQEYVVLEAMEELAATGQNEVYVLSLDFRGWLNGSVLRIYAQRRQIHTAEYAADTTKVIFDYFEEYFNMTYSISKLDKIAIPDFGTGAMENWGLITYRETNLLYDKDESSSYNKQRVASVIAHELVHQWFGNIVTMDWWDDLWLNEGFASFFEYIGVEQAEPTWGMRDIMLISDVLPVMVDDGLLSSHPIIVDVSSPAEITSVFDSISYSKKYLKDYHFKNAKTEDFWAALASVNGLPVAEVMDTWTKQMGYPVLDLTISGSVANLTQKRFLLDPKANASQPPSPLGANILDYGTAFNLTKYLVNEKDYIVWDRLASSIAYIRDMLSDTTLYTTRVEVNLRLLVYRYGMSNGNEEQWKVMFQRYKDSTLAQEKDKLLYGLASVKDVNLLSKLLEATKDESVMRSQDLFTVVRYVSLNPLGKSMAWDWTTLNWDYLVKRYTINDRNLGRLLSRITTTYNTEVQLWKMEHFFKLTPDAGAGKMPRKQAIETVRNNIEWIRINEQEIRIWLENNVA
ncbi:hypothetical protein CRUP_024388 [Coryphaenoides rupestris]|nr:hypothetical protein CRUP_024388 [Coryphaenoides rupestris]